MLLALKRKHDLILSRSQSKILFLFVSVNPLLGALERVNAGKTQVIIF